MSGLGPSIKQREALRSSAETVQAELDEISLNWYSARDVALRMNGRSSAAEEIFIADASPQMVLSLLALVEELQAALSKAFGWIARMPDDGTNRRPTCAYIPGDVYDLLAEALRDGEG